MYKNQLPGWGRKAWLDNKPFVLFFAVQLAILSVLKIIFYRYNLHFIFGTSDETATRQGLLRMVKWSLLNDSLVILVLNAPLMVLLQLSRTVGTNFSRRVLLLVFILANSTVVLLNLADVFYFRFHFQRANADLLYVLGHPFNRLAGLGPVKIVALFAALVAVLLLERALLKKFFSGFLSGKHCGLATGVVSAGMVILCIFTQSFEKFLVPTYPLTELNSRQLVMVQNSFHTFTYSLFRNGGTVTLKNYLTGLECDSLFPIRKTITGKNSGGPHKNIVLFIMESVPFDFFDPTGPYKVSMPFFDSILEKSCFYTRAFCFAHESNKGITAILAGLPTLTDVPLYHSSYVNLPVTGIGTALKKNNYHSFFCIGDEYDNFGFAKCAHWLGFDDYYSIRDVAGYPHLPMHTMGLQDESVLRFMEQKINACDTPFLAVNYNISTHYPYDLPKNYQQKFPAAYTAPMKSMCYYDHCLQAFFGQAQKEPWFTNTVFVFCSDHWLVPDDKKVDFNSVSGYHIPILLYDPSSPEKKTCTRMTSQFDILGTLLAVGGYQESFISYGGNLLDSTTTGKPVFARANASLYLVTDSAYVLGFSSSSGQAEFLYHYSIDPSLKKNLLDVHGEEGTLNQLTRYMKAFLQKASEQYQNLSFK